MVLIDVENECQPFMDIVVHHCPVRILSLMAQPCRRSRCVYCHSVHFICIRFSSLTENCFAGTRWIETVTFFTAVYFSKCYFSASVNSLFTFLSLKLYISRWSVSRSENREVKSKFVLSVYLFLVLFYRDLWAPPTPGGTSVFHSTIVIVSWKDSTLK